MLHSSDYRRPEPFTGRRVVIVGGGNSAVQIAIELAVVADVMFDRLEGDQVTWSDGMREPIDVVLLATGYLPAGRRLPGRARRL